MCAAPLGVKHPLGDALAVEMCLLVKKVEVLHAQVPQLADGQAAGRGARVRGGGGGGSEGGGGSVDMMDVDVQVAEMERN